MKKEKYNLEIILGTIGSILTLLFGLIIYFFLKLTEDSITKEYISNLNFINVFLISVIAIFLLGIISVFLIKKDIKISWILFLVSSFLGFSLLGGFTFLISGVLFIITSYLLYRKNKKINKRKISIRKKLNLMYILYVVIVIVISKIISYLLTKLI